jgi:hypothetical protein
VAGFSDDEELRSISRFELVSEYVENYYSLELSRKSAFERELARRGMPLPHMPPDPPRPPAARPKDDRISLHCFFDYLLLFYVLTGPLYAWIFLFERIVKRDFDEEGRHKRIQALISLLYIIGEAVCLRLLLED